MRAEDNTLPLTRWAMKNVENISLRPADGGVVIAVKVVSGSSRDKVAGALGDCLKITTSAAPERGRANAAVARTLAKALGVSSRSVKLITGQTNPRKEFHVASMKADDCRLRLADL